MEPQTNIALKQNPSFIKEETPVEVLPSVQEEELVSDEINDIISHNPHWIVKHGASLIGFIALSMLAFSWFIRYPDVLKVPMNIVALHSPKKVVARSEGKLQTLLVKNGANVTAQQPLAFLQSTGKHLDVLEIRQWIDNVETMTAKSGLQAIQTIQLPAKIAVGELQQSHMEFQTIYLEILQTFSGGFYQQKLVALVKDINFIEDQDRILLQQKQLLQEDYAIQQKEYNMKVRLAQEKVIAPLELGQDRSKFISKSSELQKMETQLLNQKITLHNKQKEVMELQKQIADMQSKFSTSLLVFKSKVEEWITRYVAVSPESGKLQFVSALQENQHIAMGQQMFYVEPANSVFYGDIAARQAGFGKVKEGQSVVIRVESYPSSEFGYLKGKISFISPLLVRDSSFLIHVQLPDGMNTNYNKVIPFRDNLKATAEIITQDRRLLEKLFSNVIDKARQ